MKPKNWIVAGMAAGAIALVAVTPAFASGVPPDNLFDNVAAAPDEGRGGKPDNAGPPDRPDNPGRPDATTEDGDEDSGSNNGNRPENPGNPNAITESSDADGEGDGEGDTEITRGNRPADAGRPDDAGPGVRNVPTLPDNASPRAQAAVTAAYEQQGVIQDRVAAIRALETGPGRTEAMNTLMAEFAELLHSVSDAVQAVEAGGDSLTSSDSAACEVPDATEGDDTGDGDDVTPLDEGDGTDDGTDEGSDEGSDEADVTCGDESDGEGDDSGDGEDTGDEDDTTPLDEGDGTDDGTDDGTGDEA